MTLQVILFLYLLWSWFASLYALILANPVSSVKQKIADLINYHDELLYWMELEVDGITKSKPLQVLDLIEKSKPTP